MTRRRAKAKATSSTSAEAIAGYSHWTQVPQLADPKADPDAVPSPRYERLRIDQVRPRVKPHLTHFLAIAKED